MTSLRIVFITPEYITESKFHGGLANYLQRVAVSLREYGHDPIIIVASNSNEIIRDKYDIEVHRVQTLRPLWFRIINYILKFEKWGYAITWLWVSWRLRKSLVKLMKNKHIDIVQYSSVVAPGFFRVKNIPAVIRISSFRRTWDRAMFYNDRRGIFYKQFSIVEEYALKRADAICGPSSFLLDEIKNQLGIRGVLIRTPYIKKNFRIKLKVYTTIQRELKGRPYLLYFGALSIRKGVKLLADILPEFFRKYKEYGFVFVGKNQSGGNGMTMKDYIEYRTDSFKDKVIIKTEMQHEDLYPIIKNAEIVVMPSRADNLPNACIEAMALGKLVVGTDGSSMEEIIQDRKTGILCEIDNEMDLLNKIDKALRMNKHEKNKICKNAQDTIREQLDPKITVKQLIDFYMDTILKFNNKKKAI